jgi:hypothetical protein
MLIFESLLFFYISKSAPGLAQSLLTGTPSLSAAGAISAEGGAVGAAAGIAAKGKEIGDKAKTGAARAVMGTAGTLAEAGAASKAVKEMGGTAGDQAKAFAGSVGHSTGEAVKGKVGDMTRSLLAGNDGSGGGGSAGRGVNRHSNTQHFLQDTVDTEDGKGRKQTYKENFAERQERGAAYGASKYAPVAEQKKKDTAESERQAGYGDKLASLAGDNKEDSYFKTISQWAALKDYNEKSMHDEGTQKPIDPFNNSGKLNTPTIATEDSNNEKPKSPEKPEPKIDENSKAPEVKS